MQPNAEMVVQDSVHPQYHLSAVSPWSSHVQDLCINTHMSKLLFTYKQGNF